MTHQVTLDAMVAAFRSFAILATCIAPADVEHARETVNRADSFGAFVDPTAYHRALGDGRLIRQRRVVDLFAKTTAELRELFPEGWPA
jgi:hypothetical protein